MNKSKKKKKQLSGSEAIYGFCGWLTCRKERTIMGSSEECAMIPDLIEKFCKANNLENPSENWHAILVHPIEKQKPERGP